VVPAPPPDNDGEVARFLADRAAQRAGDADADADVIRR
jgi:hypothetical protein